MSSLDDLVTRCTCCSGRRRSVPADLAQPPGLSRLAYRAGTHGGFKQSMLAALAAGPLGELGTRSDDDYTVALLDAWAAVLDVLTFYQERIANEAYLRTALEDRSLQELARLIGYQPRPGVAAGVPLVFELDPAGPESVALHAGTRAQSVPQDGGLPQSFETSEELVARPDWNVLTPRRSQPQSVSTDSTEIYLAGTATQLKPGAPLLFEAGGGGFCFQVTAVEADAAHDRTLVTVRPLQTVSPALSVDRVHALRIKTAVFGHNAPSFLTIPESWRMDAGAYYGNDWDAAAGWPITLDAYASAPAAPKWLSYVRLAQVFDEVLPGSWLVLRSSSDVEAHRVEGAAEAAAVDFTLSSRVTRVTLKDFDASDYVTLGGTFKLRATTIYAASEELALAEEPIQTPVAGTVLEVEEEVAALAAGHALVLSGEPVSSPGAAVSEKLVLDAMDGRTLTFREALATSYDRDTVEIYANVAAATHGETREEVLGSGDASLPFQRFTLRQPPLTYTSAPTPSGGESSLELRVGGVLWQEAPSFYDLGGDERAYVLRRDAEGRTAVLFGNGRRGARLPTGSENVTARYRVGIGMDGLVDAGGVALLATRPLGLRGVTNPVASSGAEDGEDADHMRTNAPLTVLTLDRVVALKDFEDFAQAFSGIGKAQARWVWDGSRRVVHLSVAGSDSEPPSSTVRDNLVAALADAGTPYRPIRVAKFGFEPLSFAVQASLRLLPGYRSLEVFPAVKETLEETFSFDRRAFAQRLATSEVLAAVQAVAGVAAVVLTDLRYVGSAGGNQGDALGLPARPARYDPDAGLRPAQLLRIDPTSISLQETSE